MSAPILSFSELLNQARATRQAQKDYYRSRSQTNLLKALEQEKKLDILIAQADKQTALFVEPGAFE